MPITTRHPQALLASGWWSRCRDCFAGSDAVKAKTTAYLPLLEGQKQGDPAYAAYLTRAMFFPATQRTVAGLTGIMLRKPPLVVAPELIEARLDDLVLSGDPFVMVTAEIVSDVLTVGRIGGLVDWHEALAVPFLRVYRAEQIVNWQEVRIGSERKLALLVLEESYELPTSDPFAMQTDVQYRLLTRTLEGVTSTVWRRDAASGRDEWAPVAPPVLLRRGVDPVMEIPFVVVGPNGLGLSMQKPPLLDLIDLNLSHYRTSADLEHGRHFTALPTPYVVGWAPTGKTLAIGSGSAWMIPEKDAKVGMLEFTGQGLKALQDAVDHKERLMATVGARLLEQSPRVQETAEAVRMRMSGDFASLGSVSMAISTFLTNVLRLMGYWLRLPDDTLERLRVDLSRDFVETRLSSQEVDVLVKAWQAGGISYETLYWNLQQGEWARPGVSWEEEQHAIEAEDGEDQTPAQGDAAAVEPEPDEAPEGEAADAEGQDEVTDEA